MSIFLKPAKFFSGDLNLDEFVKKTEKSVETKSGTKKIMQKQCRLVYLSMYKVCFHFCLLYLHLKENGKTVAKCL